MANLLVPCNTFIPNPSLPLIRKSGKAYNFISWPFLELEVIILYTCGQQTAQICCGFLEKVLLVWERIRCVSPCLLPFSGFDNRDIALDCRGHFVTMRERPKESETWYHGVTQPMPVASSSILLVMWKKINPYLRNHCY